MTPSPVTRQTAVWVLPGSITSREIAQNGQIHHSLMTLAPSNPGRPDCATAPATSQVSDPPSG